MCMSVPSSRGYAAPLGPRCHLLVLGTARLLSSPAHQTTEPSLWEAGWHTHGDHQRALLGLQSVPGSGKQVRLCPYLLLCVPQTCTLGEALALTPLHNLQLVAPPWTSASHSIPQ